jgi:hypothetical protein
MDLQMTAKLAVKVSLPPISYSCNRALDSGGGLASFVRLTSAIISRAL